MGFHTFNLIITNATTIEKMALRARLWRRGRPSNGKVLLLSSSCPLQTLPPR
jgi:hypothetical protein